MHEPTCSNCPTTRPTFHGIGAFRLCVHCWAAWREVVHIHQGGTLQTYCGTPVTRAAKLVAWEDAGEATCQGCIAAFAPVARHHVGQAAAKRAALTFGR